MNVGDRLRCKLCRHEREVTLEWLRRVCVGRPGQSAEKVRQSLLGRLPQFKCGACGKRSVEHLAVGLARPRTVRKPDTTRIDEGIAGTREDNKRMRSRAWSDIVNRGKR